MIDLTRFNPCASMVSVIDRGLPKWPQMQVKGVPVTVEQAKEIIRRTDRFFPNADWAGNDRKWRDRVMQKLRIPSVQYYPDGACIELNDLSGAWRQQEKWLTEWGYISTEYIHNDWLACSYVYGPYGWCHPDGTIRYLDNVGKWPNGRSIYKDWKKLAVEFPFLNLVCVLMSEEQSEDNSVPVMGFRVLDGNVVAFDPVESLTKEEIAGLQDTRDFDKDNVINNIINFRDRGHEHGVPWPWIEEWAEKVSR